MRLSVPPTSGSVLLSLTTPLGLGEEIQVIGSDTDEGIDLIQSLEWNEKYSEGRRRHFTASFPTPSAETTWSLQCGENVNATDCRGFFVLFADEGSTTLEEDISVSISTYFDRQDTGLLFIYARVS